MTKTKPLLTEINFTNWMRPWMMFLGDFSSLKLSRCTTSWTQPSSKDFCKTESPVKRVFLCATWINLSFLGSYDYEKQMIFSGMVLSDFIVALNNVIPFRKFVKMIKSNYTAEWCRLMFLQFVYSGLRLIFIIPRQPFFQRSKFSNPDSVPSGFSPPPPSDI